MQMISKNSLHGISANTNSQIILKQQGVLAIQADCISANDDIIMKQQKRIDRLKDQRDKLSYAIREHENVMKCTNKKEPNSGTKRMSNVLPLEPIYDMVRDEIPLNISVAYEADDEEEEEEEEEGVEVEVEEGEGVEVEVEEGVEVEEEGEEDKDDFNDVDYTVNAGARQNRCKRIRRYRLKANDEIRYDIIVDDSIALLLNSGNVRPMPRLTSNGAEIESEVETLCAACFKSLDEISEARTNTFCMEHVYEAIKDVLVARHSMTEEQGYILKNFICTKSGCKMSHVTLDVHKALQASTRKHVREPVKKGRHFACQIIWIFFGTVTFAAE
jgi:hypothetical protein